MDKKAVMFAMVIVVGVLFFAGAGRALAFVAPPSGVSAAATGVGMQVAVTWQASTSTTVVGYQVYRNNALIATTADLKFTDLVTPGAYSYTVAAYNATGEASAPSPSSAFVNVIADTTAPTTPTPFTAVPSTSSVTLSWGASTDNIGVVGYNLFRSGVKIGTGYFAATSYVDVGLMAGYTYNYSVQAVDGANNFSPSAVAQVTTLSDIIPPAPPTSLVATAVSPTEIDLKWQFASDNVGVTAYHVYQNGADIAVTASTTYAMTGLAPQGTYTYSIVAYDAVGNASAQSVSATATTLAPDVSPPAIPNGLYVLVKSSTAVSLSWQFSFDNVGVAGYAVYRDGVKIANVTSTAYTDTGLTPNTHYLYSIAAYDAAGNSSEPGPQGLAITLAKDAPSSVTGVAGASGRAVFGVALAYGARNASVKDLQTVLVAQGYLGEGNNTGFFGALTQAAVRKFQCDKGIVCSGSPATTGWGFVGVKTRAALNAL